MHNTKACWTLAIFLLTACSAGLAQSEQPSLGELARQNKAHKKAAKVLTEDDIRSLPATGVSVVGSATQDGTAQAASPAKAVAGEPAKGAAASKSAAPVSELKKALSACEEQRDSWKRSAQHYEGLLANETNDFRRQMYQDALENDRKNAAVYQKKADQLQADLTAAQRAASQGSAGPSTEDTASGSASHP